MDAKALLDSLDLGVAVIAPDLTIEEWSAAAERITRVPCSAVVGRPAWEVFGTPPDAGVAQTIRQVQLDGRRRTCVIAAGAFPAAPERGLDGEVSGGPVGRALFVFQQTPSVANRSARAARMMQGFHAERRLYNTIFQSLPSAALVLTSGATIVEANPEAERLLQVDEPAQLEGRVLTDWLSDTERETLRAALGHHPLRRQELELNVAVPGSAQPRRIRAALADVTPPSGDPRALLLAIDMSRETELERRLVQTERLSQLGGLVSGMAHELNSPLSAIAAFAEIVLDDTAKPALRESADVIRAEAVRAGRIVGTLIDFAQQRTRSYTAVDLRDVVQRVLALQRSAVARGRTRVSVDVPEDLPLVLGDAHELYQVMLNGVVNGLQAMEQTGRRGELAISAQPVNGYVAVHIQDTGPGLAPEALDRVFQPFFSTKGDGGAGLGLAISFGLVRAMGGRMWIQNIAGKGARLSFEVPMYRPAGATEPGLPKAGAEASLSVLVVENEEAVRRGVTLLATRLGHEVTSVTTLADALRLLAAVGDAHYDALLVDVHLDDGHTGFEVFEALASEGKGREQRIIFTSGDAISATTLDRLQRADRPILHKPFGMRALSEMLQRAALG